MTDLDAILVQHEGERLKPYLDCCSKPWRDCICEKKGKLTIGTGRNLDDVGISQSESQALRSADILRTQSYAATYPWFLGLDKVRQNAILDMLFNLGPIRFAGFRRLIAAMAAKDYPTAASEMMASAWSAQVKDRAVELASMIRTGMAS